MRLDQVFNSLTDTYGHTELWFYSGMGATKPEDVVDAFQNWKWPKILKRNGRAVAEFTGKNEDWELMGDYKSPDNAPCNPPCGACPLDGTFISHMILNGH